MDISTEISFPGNEVAAVATTYGLLSGRHPESGTDDMLMPEVFIMRFILDGECMHGTARNDWVPTPPVSIWGSATRVTRLRSKGPFRIFIIALRTGAWFDLTGLPPQDLVDRVVSLESFFGPDVMRLHRALREATNIGSMANLADAWLSSLKRHKIRPSLVERIRLFEDFTLFHWDRPIADLAHTLHLSTRQLERMTLEGMGLRPKMITRRHRFLNVASAMRGIGNIEWQELCYRYYSDQSHMSREFRKFAGMTPGEFREAHAPLLDASLKFRHMTYAMLETHAKRNPLAKDLPIFHRPI